MKKTMVVMLGLVLVSSSAFALSIRNSKHDLSNSGAQTIRATSSEKLCEHCHAPHNAAPKVPLWNRLDPSAASFKFYTSSVTLTTAAKNAALSTGSISLQCLSCHAASAGSAADVNAFVRDNAKDTDLNTATYVGTFAAGSGLGTDLTNDHPIGFSYSVAVSQRGIGANKGTALQSLATATNATNQMVFFNYGAKTDQMECSSCHKVHDNANPPFLRIANTGSALCRACHQN